MTNTTFTFNNLNFLHSKLDKVIQLWHRASGKGTFLFSESDDGKTDFQFGIQLDFEEVSGTEDSHLYSSNTIISVVLLGDVGIDKPDRL